MHQAVIFDLDGTAIEIGSQQVSDALAQAVRAKRSAVKLAVATGRPWAHVKHVVSQLGIIEPCIVDGGATIIDPLTETILWQENMPQKTASAILKIARRYHYKVSYAYLKTYTDILSPSSASIAGPISIFYIINIARGPELDAIYQELAQVPGIISTLPSSWGLKNGVDINITSDQATKEHGIIELCERLGVNRLNVTGVGDGHNDLHLFKAVGHKVAMGNAEPELKEAADMVIGSVEDDGLARFIEGL